MQSYGQYYIGSQIKFTGKLLVIDTIRSSSFNNDDTLSSQRWVRNNFTAGTGTVTSIGTNTGTGIIGGTITSTGLLALDTAGKVTSRARLQKVADSLGSLLTIIAGYGLIGTTTFKVDTTGGNIATRARLQKSIDSVCALISAISTPTFQQTLTAGSVLTGNNDVTGAPYRMGFGTSVSRINQFNAYTSNGVVLNTSNLLDLTAFNIQLTASSQLILTGAAISNIGVDTSTYKMLVINSSGDVKKAGYLSPTGLTGSLTVPLTDGATINTDASLGFTIGASYVVTLGGNRTIANPTNLTDGQILRYVLIQDGTGTRTVTWGSNFLFSTDTPAPTLSTAAGAIDIVGFQYRATGTKLLVLGQNVGH